jgi:hypothetical protein
VTTVAGGNFSTEIKACADACIMKLYPVSNLGRRKFIRAGHDNTGKPMKSFLRFQLPVLKGKLVKAELVLYKCYQNTNAKGEMRIFEVNSPWLESKVTWGKQPEIAAKPFYKGAPLAKAPVGKYSIDITSMVEKWYKDSEQNFGICLYSDAYGYDKQLKFHARENKFPPVLKLTTTEKLDTKLLLPQNSAMVDFASFKIPEQVKNKIIAEFKRAPFDKSAYRGTGWSAANPWFRPSPFSVDSINTYGGTDFAWDYFSTDGALMWKEVAEKYHKYGLTGLQFEIVNKAGFINIFKEAATGFELSGRKFRIMPFLSMHPKTPEKVIDCISGTLDAISQFIKKDSVLFKVDGKPVIAVYSPTWLTADEWKLVFHYVEKKHGRMIWLFNVGHGYDVNKARKYLEAFDGVTMYGCWPVSSQKELFAKLAPVMHKDFPGKIFEVAAHTNYTVHFHYGGFIPKLTEKFRKSLQVAIDAKPDSITVTNWFDIYENSRIMPSYELDDIRLKLVEYYMNIWKGKEIEKTVSPELYLANFTNILLGQNLQFEIISFPVKGSGELQVGLELCNGKGEVVYKSPFKKLDTSKLDTAFYEMPSLNFIKNKALLPRLKYKWRNRIHSSALFPQTNLVTSMRPHLLYWCRGIKHQLIMDGLKPWQIDKKQQGETLLVKPGELSVIRGFGRSVSIASAPNSGGNWIRILRNGREIRSFKTLSPWGINLSIPVQLPDPRYALDWYNIELINYKNGSRYLTPPLWVTSDARKGLVKMPILDINDKTNPIRDIQIEAVRVPFFYYPCVKSAGRILLDTSGYSHHGMIGNEKVSAKHLQKTLYRHEHTGFSVNIGSSANIGLTTYPRYQQDTSGVFLEFNGKSYAMLRGGTAFPYASTYELYIKPATAGANEDIIGAPNNQIRITRLADGRIQAVRSGAVEGEGGSTPGKKGAVKIISKSKIPAGKWTHIAAVYDLKELSLYINGKLEAKAKSKPARSHEWISSLVIGGHCGFPYNAKPSFKGGIKKVRIYGRNLSPEEFLIER